MLMKLALRNVRRSVRDYAVYFVTLTLGVAVFYAFNAIEDSRVLFEAQEGAANVFLASGASIFDILAQMADLFQHRCRRGFGLFGPIRQPIRGPVAQEGIRHVPAAGA